MTKKVLLFSLAIALILSFLLVPDSAEAVPSFARQTGMSCNTCHFQHFPALNQFGRVFKTGGYTMGGGQDMIEADMLNLPVALNMSLVTKVRFQKTNGDDTSSGTNRGQTEFPDEGAVLIGGRAGDNVGFLLELQLKDPDGSAWASFKIPFTYVLNDTTLGVTPFTTDAAGASYGLELLNTGAQRVQRPIEHRKDFSAQQFINTAMEATGITFSATQPIFFANVTAWVPEHGTTDSMPPLYYLRGAYTPVISGWDLALGFQWWDGDTRGSDAAAPCGTSRCSAEAFAVDAQAQGSLGTYPFGLYFSYAQATKSSATQENVFNSEQNDDRTAFGLLGELGVIPNKLTVALGFRIGDNGAATESEDNAFTLAAIYMLRQNVQFQLNQSFYSGDFYDNPANNENADGDSLTTLMIFAGF